METRKCVEMIRRIAGARSGSGSGSGYDTYAAKVTGITGATCTVERVLDGKKMSDVRLNATVEAADGLVIVPKIDSFVLVTNIDGDKWFVAQFSQIEKISLNVVDTIEINGGANGGTCITPELKTQLEKMTARIDGIIDAINNAVPGVQDAGVALQTTMKAKLATLTDKEDFSGIENERILQ